MLQFGSERGKDKKKQERLNEGSITLTGEQISPTSVDAASYGNSGYEGTVVGFVRRRPFNPIRPGEGIFLSPPLSKFDAISLWIKVEFLTVGGFQVEALINPW